MGFRRVRYEKQSWRAWIEARSLKDRCRQYRIFYEVKRAMKLTEDIETFQGYLKEHYAERITLDELAARFSYNKFYLQRVFKNRVGMTPNEYLIMIRIEHAKHLLRTSELPVKCISAKVGMKSMANFIHLFKKLELTTPGQWRKQFREGGKPKQGKMEI